jgi:hypothetical protein
VLKNYLKMIKIFEIIVILLLPILTLSVPAQVQDEKLDNYVDSTYRFQGIVPPVEFRYNLNEILSTPIVNKFGEDVIFDESQPTIWLRTELLISSSSTQSGKNKTNTHFTSPLYQQYLKDSEFDMVRYILGAAQVSAVAYMAYRHIKKYGFWK